MSDQKISLADLEKLSAKIEDGAWVSDLPNLPSTLAIKVRGPYNSAYNRRFAEIAAEHTPDQLADEKVQAAIDNQLVAETILLDWKGFDEPFSTAAAFRALDIKLFKRAVNWAANNVGRVGIEHVEDAAKN